MGLTIPAGLRIGSFRRVLSGWTIPFRIRLHIMPSDRLAVSRLMFALAAFASCGILHAGDFQGGIDR